MAADKKNLSHFLWRITNSQQDMLDAKDILLLQQKDVIDSLISEIEKHKDQRDRYEEVIQRQRDSLQAMADVRDHQEAKLDEATDELQQLKKELERNHLRRRGTTQGPSNQEMYKKLISIGELKLAQELLSTARRVDELERLNNAWMNAKTAPSEDNYLAEFVKRAGVHGIRVDRKLKGA
ncbi:hypothetical protein F4778DRAFT_799099 [Xylariomycetidae sp. FL2044]|nr:hypothetical protein F4778DRAFT_799099 [Xylariomycetidae sp. FL2044]